MAKEKVAEIKLQIPAGQAMPPLKLSLDEAVYVVEGRGITTISPGSAEAA